MNKEAMIGSPVQTSVEPLCPHFGICGGCAYQDLSYEQQLELKRDLVKQKLRPFLGAIDVNPVLPSLKPFFYRHMIALTVKRRQGILRLGFMGRDCRTFVPVDACAIAHEEINAYIPEALRRLNELPERKRYRTSQVVLRRGSGSRVVTGLREDSKEILECRLMGKTIKFSVSSFFQHNFSALEALVHSAKSLLRHSPKRTLLDLYCGVGLFGLLLGSEYEEVYGIEEGYESVQRARQNAEENMMQNISFQEGKVEDFLPKLLSSWTSDHAAGADVIIDPPRKGMKSSVLTELNRLRLERLIYVSCNLSALANDLEALRPNYEVMEVQPVDLFPQTEHVETVVLLSAQSDRQHSGFHPEYRNS